MPARKGPEKVNRYSIEMKRTAVRLSNAPGARVMGVTEALDIHPFMLSRWRKQSREGLRVQTFTGTRPVLISCAMGMAWATFVTRRRTAALRWEVPWYAPCRPGRAFRRHP